MTVDSSCALDAAALWAHRPFVRAIAASLLHDEHGCEDVVQETFRAALAAERAPARAALKSWLARTARHFALRELRARDRRTRRESAAAAPEALRATDELVAELAWSRRIVGAVLELELPLREAVLLRYYHGLSIAAIGRRLGAPATTIASRLERAHAALRAELGGDERGRLAAFVAGMRAIVEAPAPSTSAVPVLWAARARRAVLLLCLAIVGGAAWFALRSSPLQSEAPPIALDGVEREEASADSPLISVPVDANRSALIEPALEVSATTEPALERNEVDRWRRALPPGVLAGIVTRGRAPMREGLVLAKLDRSFAEIERPWRDAEGVLATALDAEGRFRFEGLEAGAYVVGYECAPGEPLFELWGSVSTEGPGRELVLVLGDASVSGTIYDAEGRALDGALVALGSNGSLGDEFHRFTNVRADGRYAFRDLEGCPYWWGCEPGGDPQYWFAPDHVSLPILVEGGEALVQNLGRDRRLPHVEGSLVCADGEPARGPGRFLLAREIGGHFYADFDAHGRFELRTEPGVYQVWALLPSGRVALGDAIELPDEDASLRWVLRGTRILGRIAFENGEIGALAGTDVALGEHLDRRSATVDAEGRFAFEGVAPGTWPLAARFALAPSSASNIEVREGELELRIELVVARRAADGR